MAGIKAYWAAKGIKVGVVEETPDALLALVVAFGKFGHSGARQLGDSEGAAVRMPRLMRWVTRIVARWQW